MKWYHALFIAIVGGLVVGSMVLVANGTITIGQDNRSLPTQAVFPTATPYVVAQAPSETPDPNDPFKVCKIDGFKFLEAKTGGGIDLYSAPGAYSATTRESFLQGVTVQSPITIGSSDTIYVFTYTYVNEIYTEDVWVRAEQLVGNENVSLCVPFWMQQGGSFNAFSVEINPSPTREAEIVVVTQIVPQYTVVTATQGFSPTATPQQAQPSPIPTYVDQDTCVAQGKGFRIAEGTTVSVPAGYIVTGDVQINGVTVYDEEITLQGELTVMSTTANVHAPWAAFADDCNSLETVIQNQLSNYPNCASQTGCDSIDVRYWNGGLSGKSTYSN